MPPGWWQYRNAGILPAQRASGFITTFGQCLIVVFLLHSHQDGGDTILPANCAKTKAAPNPNAKPTPPDS
ncbi:MAG: hypothetical protein ACLFQ6_12340 [Candidatus Sumerlaeia bacterium]